MNATIQCLSQTNDLTNYILSDKFKSNLNNKMKLSQAYLELIEKLWEKKSPNSYSPDKFINLILNIYPKSKYEKLGKDFIIFILENLHNELKKSINNKIEIGQPLNRYNQRNSFTHFIYEFREEVSKISDIFFGILETNSICLNCQNKGLKNSTSYNYQKFNCILFHLDEIKKYLNFNYIQYEQDDKITLNDCFNYFEKNEIIKGNNENICNICKQKSDILYTTNIYSIPNVLILILLREENNLCNAKLDFTETIDITNFVLQKEDKLIYNLYGVISQIIENNNNPYYIASCKNSIDQKWYRFYDDKISSITNVNREVISYGNPFILFYEKINNK